MITIILLFLGILTIGFINEIIKNEQERKLEYIALRNEIRLFVDKIEVDIKRKQKILEEVEYQLELHKVQLNWNKTAPKKLRDRLNEKSQSKIDIYEYLLNLIK